VRTFTKSVVIITAFAAATRAIGFIFRMFLSRILGAEMMGVYQLAMSIFMVLLMTVSSGLPLVISREIARDKNKEKSAVTAGLIIAVITSVLVCLLVLGSQNILKLILTDERSLTLLIALLPAVAASGIYCVLRAVWWGQKKFILLGATELIEQVARILLFIVCLGFLQVFGDLANLSAWSFSFACIVSAIAVFVIYVKKNGMPAAKTNKAEIINLVKPALPITGVRVVGGIAMPIVSVLLPLRLVASGWTELNAISHFGIIMGMTFPLLTIPSTVISALSTALVPELQDSKDIKQIKNKINKSIHFTLILNSVFAVIFFCFGKWIGYLLYGSTASGIYLARSAWAMVPLSLGQITSTILNSLNKENVAMRNYFIGSVFLFIIIWFLPSVIGADAIVIGLGTSALIACILNLCKIHKLISKNVNN
jgi:stage V sporulation protein B